MLTQYKVHPLVPLKGLESVIVRVKTRKVMMAKSERRREKEGRRKEIRGK